MTVVVGVDNSAAARAALRLAAQEARWRQVPLVVVSAYEAPLMRVTRTSIYQTDDACLATDQPALLPPSASAATSTAIADATRMCDVALCRRGAVWESMPNAGRKG